MGQPFSSPSFSANIWLPLKNGADSPPIIQHVERYKNYAPWRDKAMETNNDKELRPVTIDQPIQAPIPTERPNATRRAGSGKGKFSAFMAGALMVGGLSFAADKFDLFTGDAVPVPSVAPAASGTSGNNGGATTASVTTTRTNGIAALAEQANPAVVKIETKVSRQSSRSAFATREERVITSI